MRVIASDEVTAPVGEVLTLHHLNDDIPEFVVNKTVAEEKAGMVTNLTFSPDKV